MFDVLEGGKALEPTYDALDCLPGVEEFGVMKPREKSHSPGGLGASWLGGVGRIRGIYFLIREDTGFLVVHCLV